MGCTSWVASRTSSSSFGDQLTKFSFSLSGKFASWSVFFLHDEMEKIEANISGLCICVCINSCPYESSWSVVLPISITSREELNKESKGSLPVPCKWMQTVRSPYAAYHTEWDGDPLTQRRSRAKKRGFSSGSISKWLEKSSSNH